MSTSHNIRNSLLAIFACLLWATPPAFIKMALVYIDPMSMAWMRFLLSALIQIPFCGSILGPFKLLKTNLGLVLIVAFLQTAFVYAGFFFAMTMMRGAQASIVIGAGPLVSAIVAHFMMSDDKLTKRTVVSTTLGISGIALISLASKPWTPVGFKELLGMLLLLSGSTASAFSNVIIAKKRGNINPVQLNCIQMLVGSVMLMALAFPLEGVPDFNLPLPFWLELGWLSFVSAAAFGIWFYLLSKVKVSKLNIWKFIIPISGSILSWALLPSESPDALTLFGMAIIIAGICVGQKREKAS